MNTRKRLSIVVPIFVVGLLAIFFWQLPTLLKAVPSRYLARLPEPIAAIGAPDEPQSAVLPTAVVSFDDANALLGSNPEPDAVQQVANVQPEAESTAMLLASPTPIGGAGPTLTPFSTATLDPNITPTPEPIIVTPTIQPTPTLIATKPPIPAFIKNDGFTHEFQTWNNCGPTTIAMALSTYGISVDQYDTAEFLKPDPEDRNVSPSEMARYVNEQTGQSALWRANGDQHTVKSLIAAGFPVVLEIGINPPGAYSWMGWYGHYLLAIGYDDNTNELITFDSWLGTSEHEATNWDDDGRRLTYSEWDRDWLQFNRNYIVLYKPEEAGIVAGIIGESMDDELMWHSSLTNAQNEVRANENNGFAWFNLGTSFAELGHYEEAGIAYDRARASQDLPWRMLWYQFGAYETYYELGRHEDVINLANLTLKDRPYFEEVFYYRGLSQIALGDTNSGLEDIRSAASFNPYFEPAQSKLAELGG